MSTRTIFAMLAAAALLAGASGLAAAKDTETRSDRDDEREEREGKLLRGHDGPGKRAEFGARGDKWVFHNDQIAVWFHAGKHKAKPDLRVAFNGSDDDERSGYRVKILRLCEVPEGETDCKGHLPRINLAKADDWNVVTEEGNGTLTLRMVRAEAQGIVTLVWRLDTANATVKYDVQVENWRWANASHRLALDMIVLGKNLRNATGANVTIEDSGYIAWETTAKATYADGSEGNLTVDAVKKGGKDDKDEDGDSGARLVLVFNGTGGYRTLDYDPTLGVASRSSALAPTPGLAPALVVAVAFAAALVATRRRA